MNMKKELIGETLKSSRKRSNLSVNEVAEAFKEINHPVAAKTIYGWESGKTQPDADTLLFLCGLYNIDNVLESFGYHVDESDPVILTDTEKEIMKAYRLHPEMHEAIRKLLEL